MDEFPLLDNDGQEIPIYNSAGARIPRRVPVVDKDLPPCGVLVNLTNVQALFDPYGSVFNHDDCSTTSSDLAEPHIPHVDIYPLAFLKSVGNVQADGIPPCFYPLLTDINRSVRKHHLFDSPPSQNSDDHSSSEEDRSVGTNDSGSPSSLPVVKPVSAQFYNYITHRVATRAGKHDAQQGTITAAISGAFATSQKHKGIASNKQLACDSSLPSDRFHSKISLEDCPTSCRAEFVYSVDVRALKNPSGMRVLSPPFPASFPFLTFYPTAPYSMTSFFHSPDPGSHQAFAAPSRTI